MKRRRVIPDESDKIQYFGLGADDSVRIHRLFSPVKVPRVLSEEEIKVCLFLHGTVYPDDTIESEKLEVLEEAVELSPCATESLKKRFVQVLAAKKWASEEIGKAKSVLATLGKK